MSLIIEFIFKSLTTIIFKLIGNGILFPISFAYIFIKSLIFAIMSPKNFKRIFISTFKQSIKTGFKSGLFP